MARTRQPQQPTRIDPQLGPVSALFAYGEMANPGLPAEVYRDGIGWNFTEGNSVFPSGSVLNAATGAYSFVAVSNGVGTASSYSNVFNAYHGTDGVIQLRHTADTWYFYHRTASDVWVSTTTSYAHGHSVFVGTFDGATIKLFSNDRLVGSASATGIKLAPTQIVIGSDWGDSGLVAGTHWLGGILLVGLFQNCFHDHVAARLSRNPWQLFAPQRRIWIQLGAAAGGTVVTESATGRLRAKATDTNAPIRTEAAVGKRKARGTVTDTAIHDAAAVGRRTARGAATAAPAIRVEAAVGRVTARGTTTYTHISAGQNTETVAGRSKARAAVSVTPIRAETVVARRQVRGSDAVVLTRTESAFGRRKLRAGVTAAPLVAGMITEAAVGRLQARGSLAATSALRVEAVASRREARGSAVIIGIRDMLAVARARLRAAVTGAPYVAPTLPLEVPESSRILVDKTERLGASPAPTIWDPVLGRRVPAPRKPTRLG